MRCENILGSSWIEWSGALDVDILYLLTDDRVNGSAVMIQLRVEKNVILEESCFKPALCLIVTRCSMTNWFSTKN